MCCQSNADTQEMAIESRNILSGGRETHTPCPAVSVVVPNFNYARYLPQRIESVLNQTFTDFEVILLDDASTDNSVEVMRRYAETDNRISRIEVNATNSGSPFLQWERGVKLARGRYIWIAEADDFADPEFLASCMKAFETDNTITMAMTMSHLVDSEGNPSGHKPFEDFEPDGNTRFFDGRDFIRRYMTIVNGCYNASMVLFRKDCYTDIKDRTFTGMRYCGDWMLWLQMMLQGKVARIDRRLNSFRLHGRSVTDASATAQRGRPEEMAVDLFLLSVPHLLTTYQRRRARYRTYRDLRKRPELLSRVKELCPRIDSILRVNRVNFMFYWIYMHAPVRFRK